MTLLHIRKLSSFVCHKNSIMAKVEKRALGTILTMKLHSVGNMKLKKTKIRFSKQIQNTLTLSQLGVGGRLCPTIGFASPKMSCQCILVELCT